MDPKEGGLYVLVQLQMRSLPVSWTQQLVTLTRFMESPARCAVDTVPLLLTRLKLGLGIDISGQSDILTMNYNSCALDGLAFRHFGTILQKVHI